MAESRTAETVQYRWHDDRDGERRERAVEILDGGTVRMSVGGMVWTATPEQIVAAIAERDSLTTALREAREREAMLTAERDALRRSICDAEDALARLATGRPFAGRAVGLREMHLSAEEARELEWLLENPVAQPNYASLQLPIADASIFRRSVE